MFLNPDFLRGRNFGDSAINKGYIAHFSLRMRETAVFSTVGLKYDVTIVFLDPDSLRGAKISAIRLYTFKADIVLVVALLLRPL